MIDYPIYVVVAYAFVVFLFLVGIPASILAFYLLSNKFYDKNTVNPLVEEVENNVKQAQQALVEAGIQGTERYEYGEYYDKKRQPVKRLQKFKLPPNVHLVLDENSRQVAFYALHPYEFNSYAYDDVISCELCIEQTGNVKGNVSSVGLGTSFGPIGVGASKVSGNIKKQVRGISVLIYFKDGKQFTMQFLKPGFYYTNTPVFEEALATAKSFLVKIQYIIDASKEARYTNTIKDATHATELLKWKELLDMNLITEEEFNQKRKQILGV